MNRILIGSLAALAIAACQQNSADKVADARHDLEQTRVDAQNDVAKEQAKANDDVAKEQAKAEDHVADTQKDADKRVKDKEKDLAEAHQDRADKTGEALTTTGVVRKVDNDDFKLHTETGRDLTIGFGDVRPSAPLHEGDQVRATYKVDGRDNVAEHLEVINPAK